MTFTKGDRVRCSKTIYAGTVPSILEGCQGVVEKLQDGTPYPVHVLWDGNILCSVPYLCAVTEAEIELV